MISSDIPSHVYRHDTANKKQNIVMWHQNFVDIIALDGLQNLEVMKVTPALIMEVTIQVFLW